MMKEPDSFKAYKKNKELHKYDYTQEAHWNCEAYERHLMDKIKELDYTEKEHTVKVKKVNGIVIHVESDMTMLDWRECINYLNK